MKLNYHRKYIRDMILLVIALVLLVVANHALSSTIPPSFKQVILECTGFRVTLDQHGTNPLVASISSEKGTWVEIPNEGKVVYLYNIETSKIATLQIGEANFPYLNIYRDIDFYRARMAQHTLRCSK